MKTMKRDFPRFPVASDERASLFSKYKYVFVTRAIHKIKDQDDRSTWARTIGSRVDVKLIRDVAGQRNNSGFFSYFGVTRSKSFPGLESVLKLESKKSMNGSDLVETFQKSTDAPLR